MPLYSFMRLFWNREIIAPVLKEVVPEYKNSTVEEIIRYIDADSIRDIPVGDIPAEVEQLQTEMSSPSDKLIRYDTHFKSAIVPGRNSNYINSSRGNNVGNFMPNSL